MGQVLKRFHELEKDLRQQRATKASGGQVQGQCQDLAALPPELSLLVLSHLNATDLCLAACVWEDLAKDELLWQGLCFKQFGPISSCRMRRRDPTFSYRTLYLELDEGRLTFNADYIVGMEYMLRNRLLEDVPNDIARFMHFTKNLDNVSKREFLKTRLDVLEELVKLQNFENQFLPNALRKFFQETHPPNDRGSYLHDLVDKFSERFCTCNPALGLPKDSVYVVCFSLILLSVDLSSPHIKNKMSKREFIRNTRQAAHGINDEFAGHLYDNVYLIGHVAPHS